ncbi:MAG: hypothetical protein AB7O32_16025, partial [Vicinamibacterales bacterium]
LPTPRYLWLHLARELGRARRARSDVGVIALTVGGLDAQAAQAARAVTARLRGYDLCVPDRPGSLVVVLSDAGYRETTRKAAEMVEAIEALRREPGGSVGQGEPVTAGIAIFPHDADSAEALISVARERTGGPPPDRATLPFNRV